MMVLSPTSGPRKTYARIRRNALSINTMTDTFMAIPADSRREHMTIARPDMEPSMRFPGMRK